MADWQRYIESRQMVFFGPVLDGTGSWGLGVVEADDEQEIPALASKDPVVTSGTGRAEVGRTLGGSYARTHRPGTRTHRPTRGFPSQARNSW
jgi:YCII-related domain